MEYLLGRQYSEVLKVVRTPHFSTPVHLLPKGISYRIHDVDYHISNSIQLISVYSDDLKILLNVSTR